MTIRFEVQPNAASIITTSKLRAWWLVHWRGYHLRKASQIPEPGLFGRIRYTRRLALDPPKIAH